MNPSRTEPEFTIVIPTVKTNLQHHTNAILENADLPINLIILHGHKGKPQTLNQYKLNPLNTKYTIFLDDDLIPCKDFTSQLKTAIEQIPKPGVISFYYETEEGKAYMMYKLLEKPITHNNRIYYEAKNINIAGGLHCIPTNLLKHTIVPDKGVKYDYSDDASVCNQLRALGYKNYYIKDINNKGTTILHYTETQDYIDMKSKDLKKLRGY